MNKINQLPKSIIENDNVKSSGFRTIRPQFFRIGADITLKKILLLLGVITMVVFTSCEKDESLPFDVNFVEHNEYDNNLTRFRVIIQNNTDKTIYYTKFRLELRKEGKNVNSDVYEFGNKNDKNSWNVEPGDAKPTSWVSCSIPYYQNEKEKYSWHITEIIEYLSF